jgi:acetyl esterase/lipase
MRSQYAGSMPRPVLLGVLCLAVVSLASACALRSTPEPSSDPARTGSVAPTAAATSTIAAPEATHHDLAYADGGRMLDLYLPREGRAPVIVWLHGGSWIAGDKRPVPRLLLDLRDRGFAVAAVNYRLTGLNSHPAQLHDVKGAVRWLRANSEAYRLDPGRVYLVGFSAGAHLASLAALTAGDTTLEGDVGGNAGVSSAVGGVVAIAGPTDLPRMAGECSGCEVSAEFQALGCAFLLCGGRGRAASPLTYVHRGAPPFLLLHGEADRVVPAEQARLLDAALRASGVPSSLLVTPGGGHGTPDLRADEAARRFLLGLAGIEG